MNLGSLGAIALGVSLFAAPRPNGPGPAADGEAASNKDEAKANVEKKKAGPRTPIFAPTGSRLPVMGHPTMQTRTPPPTPALSGWAAEMQSPRFVDHRRRHFPVEIPESFGPSLGVGERLAFDVEFAGNPAGNVEAWVAAREQDPRGEPPHGSDVYRVESKAVTSGVVSMLTEISVRMTSWIDHRSGAPVHNVYLDDRKGLGARFAHRKMELFFHGRGGALVVDTVDGKVRKMTHAAPNDAFDVLSAMAWVRSLALAEGERSSAHVIDGKVLLRLDVIGRGSAKMDPWPTLASALDVTPEGIRMLEGTLTRVDYYDDPVPGKRSYQFRAWVSTDDRRLVLRLESDMWLGIIRLTLVGYDPPNG